jgi:DNA-binding transcriptional LysR family regulator
VWLTRVEGAVGVRPAANEFDTVVTGAMDPRDQASRRRTVLPASVFAATVLPKAIVAFGSAIPAYSSCWGRVGRKIVGLVKSEEVDFGIAGGSERSGSTDR